jgi:hypothetical protein
MKRFQMMKRTAAVALIFSAAAIQSVVAAEQDVQSLVSRGRGVYKSILQSYPGLTLYLEGGSYGARAGLVAEVPSAKWKSLSKKDQIALTLFVESELVNARRQPSKYSLMPNTAPLWPATLKEYQSLCDSCWRVSVGKYSRSLRALDGTVDWNAVDGSTAAAFRGAFIKNMSPHPQPGHQLSIETFRDPSVGYISASTNLWTGVKLYQKSGVVMKFFATVIGGTENLSIGDGKTVRAVKIRYPNGSIEWKTRDLVGSMMIRPDDAALRQQKWIAF